MALAVSEINFFAGSKYLIIDVKGSIAKLTYPVAKISVVV